MENLDSLCSRQRRTEDHAAEIGDIAADIASSMICIRRHLRAPRDVGLRDHLEFNGRGAWRGSRSEYAILPIAPRESNLRSARR